MCCFCHHTTEILYKPIKRQIQKEREEGKTDKQRKTNREKQEKSTEGPSTERRLIKHETGNAQAHPNFQ